MGKLLAYCGVDCAGCEAYRATQADDAAAKLEIWARWKVDYQQAEMPIEAVTCDGCAKGERVGGYCAACPVRACSIVRGVPNCAYCEDFDGCETLSALIGQISDALQNLAAVRATL